jgi:hypothetical protein
MSQSVTSRPWIEYLQDWKFLASTVLAVAGIVVPVWLWQSDQNPQSLEVEVLSTVPMKIDAIGNEDDIQIVVKGQTVTMPYLSTVELINNGKKPIPAGDFHSPITFSVGGKAQVIKATVTSTFPAEISTELSAVKHTMSLQPLLLNPGDTIRMAVITSTAEPLFSVTSRIAGIKRIEVLDRTREQPNWSLGLGYLAASICLVLLYALVGASLMFRRSLTFGLIGGILVAMSLALGSVALMRRSINLLHIEPTYVQVILAAFVAVSMLWLCKKRGQVRFLT